MKEFCYLALMLTLMGCSARQTTQVPVIPSPLYYQGFDAINGTDETAYEGEWSHSRNCEPLVIHCADIGLTGQMEYCIEFMWLPGNINALIPRGSGGRLLEDTAKHRFTINIRREESQLGYLVYGGVFNGTLFDLLSHNRVLWSPRTWYKITVTGSFATGQHRSYINGDVVGFQTSVASAKGWDIIDLTFLTQVGWVDEVRIWNLEWRPSYVHH